MKEIMTHPESRDWDNPDEYALLNQDKYWWWQQNQEDEWIEANS